MGTGVGGGASTASTGSGTSSSSGAGGAGGAGSFTPADLPGLALWLDDDKGVVVDPQHPGTMLRWLDQSGNANDATATAIHDGFRFDIDPAAVHGHDAFKCHGSGQRLEVPDATSLHFGTGPYAVAVVINRLGVGDPDEHAFFTKNLGDGGIFLGLSANAYHFRQLLSDVSLAEPNGTPFHAVIGRGPALDIHLGNMSAVGPVATSNVDETGAPVVLCLSGLVAEMEIAEVVAVKGALSDANLAKLQGYFNTKFNL